MNPFVLAILLFGLGLGTMTTLASTHWVLAWMGLEINTLAILPLMSNRHHPRAVEATTKYFVAQATAAALLLFASSTNAWLTGYWSILHMTHPLPVTLLTLALALKVGLAPAHVWLPEVLQGLDFTTGLILSTWQKLGPFALLLQLQPSNSTVLISFGVLSILVGGWGGLNQTQVRKILAYSSIAHLGWMVLVLQFSPSLTLLTLITYFIMTSSAFMVFKFTESTNIASLTMAGTKSPIISAFMPLILLSLGGLPPLTGFMPKWLILQELAKQGLAITATAAALSALLSLFFYLRLCYAMTLTMPSNTLPGTTPWRLSTAQLALPLAISTAATILLLPISPALVTLTSLW